MTKGGSILERAQALRADARRLGDSAKDKEDALRVADEVGNAEKNLDALEKLLTVVVALRELGVDVDTGELTDGLERFARHAGTGLPSWKATQDASAAIKGVHTRVSEAVGKAWRTWATEVINNLPTDRLSLLSHGRAGSVNRTLEQMHAARAQSLSDPAVIATFLRNCDIVHKELSTVEDPGPHLRAVLQQVQDGTTLDQLSDDDIAVLREKGWAEHIVVKRADFE